MTELFGHWPNAAEAGDDRSDAHETVVRKSGTIVNLESVRPYAGYDRPMGSSSESVGLKLRALKDRSGMSLQAIATAMGLAKSSAQRYFEVDYRPSGVLDLQDAISFASVFVGKGKPPITNDDVLALTALPQVNGAMAPQAPAIAEPVADVMAKAYCSLILQGREPTPGVPEALARMIRELSLLHQRDPALRDDAGRTEGALQILALQLQRTLS